MRGVDVIDELVVVTGLQNYLYVVDVAVRASPVLDEERFDLVAMARALIREPDFPKRLREQATAESRCEPCNRCMATMYHGLQVCPQR